MNAVRRTILALAVTTASLAPAVRAQIPGMPLFTNPRYATGLRIHADYGMPTTSGSGTGDLTVIQGGVTFALGPVGIGANVGTRKSDFSAIQGGCANCTSETSVTGSTILQLRVLGAGRHPGSLSLFGGASVDLKAEDFANSGMTQAQRDSLKAHGIFGDGTKVLTIPVGIALGYHLNLGIASLNLWGSPRVNLTKYINCPATCPATPGAKFRWAVGADLPIFRIISVRAAYDSGKDVAGSTFSVWGVGASIGIGGMR